MSFLGSLGSALTGSSVGGLADWASSWINNSAKESLNKNITKTNLKVQKEYDTWTQAQDKAYETWWQEYLYKLQNENYYKLAEKYATNTARWAVEGLKRAGLNPILAGIDSNLSSSMGDANVQASGHKVGGGSVHGASVSAGSRSNPVNIAAGMQSLSSARQSESQAELTKVQSEIADKTKDAQIERAALETEGSEATNRNIMASTAKNEAEADLVKAQALSTLVEAGNAAQNNGLSGIAGGVSRVINEVGQGLGSAFGSLTGFTDKRTSSMDNIMNGINAQSGYFSGASTAKGQAPRIRVQKPSEVPWYRRSINYYKVDSALERVRRSNERALRGYK